jgi:hypothetical protein
VSFLFPLGDIVPPAAANALFPEQTSVPFAAAAGQNGSAIFPELLTALSEAEAGPPSLDATDGLSPAGSPTAPVFTRPVVWAGRQERLGRLAKANDEECDAAACAARYIFPWAGTSQETMTGFGLSLSLPLPSSDLEHGEAAVSQDSDLHDSQLVMHAGFLPTEPLVEKPPVSADAFVEVRQVGEALLERDEPQLSSGVNTLPAAESEIAIPLWAKTEKTAAEEPSPELPHCRAPPWLTGPKVPLPATPAHPLHSWEPPHRSIPAGRCPMADNSILQRRKYHSAKPPNRLPAKPSGYCCERRQPSRWNRGQKPPLGQLHLFQGRPFQWDLSRMPKKGKCGCPPSLHR